MSGEKKQIGIKVSK